MAEKGNSAPPPWRGRLGGGFVPKQLLNIHHPDFRHLGLGRAILQEGLRRLYAQGVQEVFVETDNYRDAAFALYESVGFRVVREVLVFRKDYAG